MNKYKQSLTEALDVIKDSKRCLDCVGNCVECEYYKALDQIENAIETLEELVEKETSQLLQDAGFEDASKYLDAEREL